MRLRNRSMAGSSLGPSTPQFQLRLAPAPSQLFSPLASLCFPLYETRSFRVKPSWQVRVIRLPSRVLSKDVVRLVGEALKTEGWPVLVALSGMIENHIENYLDSSAV